jgi:hypothetical protein
MPPARFLRLIQACEEAVVFASTEASCFDGWEHCPRADWLLWLLQNFGGQDTVKARLFACWCARETPLADGRKLWDLLTNTASRCAVEVAERYARGRASDEERIRAWEDATWVATAGWAGGPSPAASAAAAAAWAVAELADAQQAADSALTAAGKTDTAVKAQVDALRAIFGNPFLPVAPRRGALTSGADSPGPTGARA